MGHAIWCLGRVHQQAEIALSRCVFPFKGSSRERRNILDSGSKVQSIYRAGPPMEILLPDCSNFHQLDGLDSLKERTERYVASEQNRMMESGQSSESGRDDVNAENF